MMEMRADRMGRPTALLLAAALCWLACSDGRTTSDAHEPAGKARGADTLAAKDSAKVTGAEGSANETLATVTDPELAKDTIPLLGVNGEQTRYGIRSARLRQRFTGNRLGARTIVFTDYGMRERREENAMPYPEGRRGSLHNVITIITSDENAYVDVRTKQGYSRPNEGFKEYLAAGAGRTIALGELIIRRSGATHIGDTTLAGYQCRVYQKKTNGLTITNWLWRGIPLREHLSSPQDTVEYTTETIELEPNIDVPDSMFKFSRQYKIQLYKPGSAPSAPRR